MSLINDWQLGFSTNAFVRFGLEDALVSIAGIGFDVVEILADRPHLFPGRNIMEDVKVIARLARTLDLSVGAINSNTVAGYYTRDFWEPVFEPSLANPDMEARRWRINHTLACMDMAEILGTEVVVINSGRMNSGCPPEKGRHYFYRSLEVLLMEAEKRGLKLALEYEPGLLIERADEAMLLLDDFDSPSLGINLDVGHSWVVGEDPAFIIASLQDKLFHVHLEDIKGRKHYHLVPGQGDIPLMPIFSSLDRIHFQGSVILELYTYPDQPEQAARAALQYLQQEIFDGLHRTTHPQRSSYNRRLMEYGDRRYTGHC